MLEWCSLMAVCAYAIILGGDKVSVCLFLYLKSILGSCKVKALSFKCLSLYQTCFTREGISVSPRGWTPEKLFA